MKTVIFCLMRKSWKQYMPWLVSLKMFKVMSFSIQFLLSLGSAPGSSFSFSKPCCIYSVGCHSTQANLSRSVLTYGTPLPSSPYPPHLGLMKPRGGVTPEYHWSDPQQAVSPGDWPSDPAQAQNRIWGSKSEALIFSQEGRLNAAKINEYKKPHWPFQVEVTGRLAPAVP